MDGLPEQYSCVLCSANSDIIMAYLTKCKLNFNFYTLNSKIINRQDSLTPANFIISDIEKHLLDVQYK